MANENIELNNFYWNIESDPNKYDWELVQFAKLWNHCSNNFRNKLRICAITIKKDHPKEGGSR